MATFHQPTGRIVTLYSFKGGVGRTMSGANVAFTAAMSGLRVLVMDWDLEAPGMAYYFRGLGDPEQSRDIRSAPGVMDLVWGWRKAVGAALGEEDVTALVDRYASGDPFKACVRPVLGGDRLPDGATLDILGAGSRQIDEAHVYAEALAHFSWPEFLDQSFGGIFLDRLRQWAKSHYDLILVDSRTGYADVASVCTVQLPDVVALSFIYNRQNIEGVAAVADSIAAQRGDRVKLRAVPMRLSREGTLDEADARGRAVRHLTRNGAFAEDSVKLDLDRLPIRTAQGLPFYETIAALMPASSSAELLMLDYKRLAEALCDQPLALPTVDEEWRAAVARRLEPKTASVEYIHDLREADAVRAVEELDRLLDGALESELHDDRLEREYVEALIDAGLSLTDFLFDEAPIKDVAAIADKALKLARSEYDMDPMGWALDYVNALMTYDDQFAPPAEPDERLETLLEYDRILAGGAWRDSEILLRRAAIRRELVTLPTLTDPEVRLARIGEALGLLDSVTGREYVTEVMLERAGLHLQRARLALAGRDTSEAWAAAQIALEQLEAVPPFERSRIGRLLPDAHLFLAAISPDGEAAAEHVLRAAAQPSLLTPLLGDLSAAVTALLRSSDAPAQAVEFVRRLLPAASRGAHSPSFFFSRSPAMANTFVKAAARLLVALSAVDTPDAAGARDNLLRAVATCLELLRRRPFFASPAARQRDLFNLLAESSGLVQLASDTVPTPVALRELTRSVANLDALVGDLGDNA